METETRGSEETQAEKEVLERRKRRKRRITIFVIVSLLNVALLALLWSQLLTSARNQTNAGGGNANPLEGRSAPEGV